MIPTGMERREAWKRKRLGQWECVDERRGEERRGEERRRKTRTHSPVLDNKRIDFIIVNSKSNLYYMHGGLEDCCDDDLP
jgi:hypothetical protein